MKRMKWVAMVVVAAALLVEFAFSGFNVASAGPAGKVVICHNTGSGNVTIEVSANAVAKHLSEHGDHVGPCRN